MIGSSCHSRDSILRIDELNCLKKDTDKYAQVYVFQSLVVMYAIPFVDMLARDCGIIDNALSCCRIELDAQYFGGQLTVANFRPDLAQVRLEFLQCPRTEIGKMMPLDVRPHQFNRIQFRTVRWEVGDAEPFVLGNKIRDHLGSVNFSVVYDNGNFPLYVP